MMCIILGTLGRATKENILSCTPHAWVLEGGPKKQPNIPPGLGKQPQQRASFSKESYEGKKKN